MVDCSLARIAYRVTSWYVTQLQDGSLQRRDIVDCLVRSWVDTIQAQAQSAHIHLMFREVIDARRVVHVADNLMAERSLKFLATLIEECKLMGRELVEVVSIRANEVREDRTRDDSVLLFQSLNQFVHILLWVKT